MQTGNNAYPSQPSYQYAYHAAVLGPQDHELKKQYLALLPPQQIIEICLTFDSLVPPYVQSRVWPTDINAAIAAMQKPTPPAANSLPGETAKSDAAPVMSSLADALDPPPASAPEQPPSDPGLSGAQSLAPGPSPQPQTTQPEQTNTQPTQPAYPHQPYGFMHTQTAYPHAPYYPPPPPGYPPYPPTTYPPYSQIPGGYPQHPHPLHFPSQANSLFTQAPLNHATQSQDASNNNAPTDDLPSYEEMIVEALTDSGEAEGCAPKDLFTWMASRYPLQSNFRPSASQALQKAFKRGRFQKSSGGKYRLNATWEGGNTSRRTTRRPQTQTQTTAANSASMSPFTHAPLLHHSPPVPPHHAHQPYPASGYGFPFSPAPQAPPGYPGYPLQPPAPAPPPSELPSAAEDRQRPAHPEGDVADAYEAARNILKAINFGNLFESSAEVRETAAGISEADTPAAGATVASADGALHSATRAVTVGNDSSSGPALATGGNAEASTTNAVDLSGQARAKLQAQLALLAAQLAELAQVDDDEAGRVDTTGGHPLDEPVAPQKGVAGPQEKIAEPEQNDESDDDMEEVI